MTYLAPSVLGMNNDGFGGSLWHRGTFTGRGLFRGAGKKIFKKDKSKDMEEDKFISLNIMLQDWQRNTNQGTGRSQGCAASQSHGRYTHSSGPEDSGE